MAVVIFCVVVFWVTVGRGQTSDNQNQRPFRDGISGERAVEPFIQAGKPWLSDIDDNDAGFGTISSTQKIDNIPLITKKMFDQNAHLITEFQETSTSGYEEWNTFKSNALLESIGPLELPQPNTPPFAGLTIEGKTPVRNVDHEEFNFTSPEPQLVDKFENTTTIIRRNGENKSITNQIIGSSRPLTLPKPIRPSFAGQTGGGTPPQIIQPGKPWPSRPEDYGEFSATSLKPQLIDRIKETTSMRPQGDSDSTHNQITGSSRPSQLPKPSRPSFAGQTGGGIPPQTIQPGKPWPSKPEDYGEFSSTTLKPQLIDRFKETTTMGPQGDSDSTPNQVTESSRPSKLPKPSRPSFAGQTGGGTPPQIIQPGKPWPSRPEDYGEFSATTLKLHLIDRFEETATMKPQGNGDTTPNQIIGSSGLPKSPKPSRPSFAGQTGGGTPPQTIQPGKPWPSKPEDYGEFSASTLKPPLIDRFEETASKKPQGDGDSTTNQIIESSRPPKLPKPSRPSFAGPTGGGTPPQTISPGEPWPSKPEDYGEFSATSLKPQLIDRLEEIATMKPQGDGDTTPNQIIESSGPPKLSKPTRPSFAGQTGGGTPPQTIQPGRPWPFKPEDYGEFSATSLKPQVIDRFEETATMKPQGENDSTPNQIIGSSGPPKLPKPSRPSFAGQTGGGTPVQTIQPGKPWPSKSEDYGEFSATTLKPQLIDRLEETATMKPQGDGDTTPNQIIESSGPPKLSKPTRPSFAGQTGGGTSPQTIQPGKPWPSRPEYNGEFSASSLKPQLVDRFEGTTMRPQGYGDSTSNQMIGSSGPPKLPKPSRPSFAGLTGGTPPSQVIPPGKPWPARPEDYEGFSVTSRKPQLADKFKETTKLQKVNISDTLKSIVQPERILPPSSLSIKPWPTKQAEEMMTKIKDEIFFSKKVSNSSPVRPEVNNLLLVDSPFFRQIFKSNNPWHASQKIVEDSTPELLSFRPEDDPFTSAPSTRFIRI